MLSFRLSSQLLTLLPVIGIFIIVTEDNSLYDPPLSSSDIQCIMYMFLCFEQSVQLSCIHVAIFNFLFSSKKSTAVCKKKKKLKFCPQFIFHHLLSLPRYHNLNYIVIGLTMYRNFILYSLWTHNKQNFGVNLQLCEIFNMLMYDREKQPCKLYAECTSYMYVLFQQCTAVVYIVSDYLVSWLQAIVSSFI